MSKKLLYFVCATLVCTSLMGCGLSEADSSVSVERETEIMESDTGATVETEIKASDSEVETEAVEEGTEIVNKILPLPNDIDINNLDNCTVAISLEQGDAYVDDTGAMQMDVTVYTYDLYDMVDIATLKEGDIIVIRGQEIEVTSLERIDRGLLINGGLDENGYELSTDDTTVWYESGYSDVKSYYEIGKATIRVSADMNFYDSSDLDKGEVIYYPGDFLTDNAGILYHFVPNNTRIVISDGMIIEMYRSYMP